MLLIIAVLDSLSQKPVEYLFECLFVLVKPV